MLRVRPLASVASLLLTAGLLGGMILSLASRTGGLGQNRDAALHAFDVATPAHATDRAVAQARPDRAREPAQAPPNRYTNTPSAHPLATIDLDAGEPSAAPMVSGQAAPAPDGERPQQHGASPASVALHFVDAPTLPASAPRADTNAYAAHVLAWLKRHQHFPDDHVRNAFDATVLIAFTIDRRGRAGDVRIVRGSGVAWLDALALRQVRNASPFPRPFNFAPAQPLRFEVPMRYRARR